MKNMCVLTSKHCWLRNTLIKVPQSEDDMTIKKQKIEPLIFYKNASRVVDNSIIFKWRHLDVKPLLNMRDVMNLPLKISIMS